MKSSAVMSKAPTNQDNFTAVVGNQFAKSGHSDRLMLVDHERGAVLRQVAKFHSEPYYSSATTV